MNPIVIYESTYGAAEKYAKHIANSLGCKALPLKEAKTMPLDAYDAIVFGGGVYVSKINGAKFIINNFDKIKGKKLAVFAVTLSPVEVSSVLQSCIDASFPAEMRDKIKFFHFRGGMDFNKLSFIHRSMMRMMTKMLKKKPAGERSEHDNGVISIVEGKSADFFDATATATLIEFTKN